VSEPEDEVHPDASPGPDELEMAELRRRKKEAVREEQRNRASGIPEDEPYGPEPGGPEWIPPKEMATREVWSRFLRRVLFFALLLAAGFLLARSIADRVLTPRLEMGEALVPSGTVAADSPVTFGVLAVNRSRARGEAFAVLVIDDLVETQGHPVEVPPRSNVTIPVEASIPPGDHVATLLLYDAWRDGGRIGALHGIPLRVGEPLVDVTDAVLGPFTAGGDSLQVEIELVNRTGRNERLTPVLVFQSEVDGEEVGEVSGPDLAVGALETAQARFTVSLEGLAEPRYLVSVIAITGRGDRTGAGVHGIPLRPDGVP